MSTVIAGLLVVIAVVVLLSPDLLSGVIFMAVFSILSSVLFFYLHAPDIALTEAAVGAGVSTFIYVWVIRKTRRRDLP